MMRSMSTSNDNSYGSLNNRMDVTCCDVSMFIDHTSIMKVSLLQIFHGKSDV